MPLPGGATGFTLTGGPYDDPAFQGMEGILTMSTSVTHVATGERIRKTWPFSIDYSGNFSVGPLPFSDDPAFTPTGFTYTITWQALSYKDTPGNLTFAVPTASGTTIDFDTLAPTTTGQPALPTTVFSVNGHTGAVTLAKADVGLGNVDNTSDVNKPVSTAQQTALNGKVSTSGLDTAVAGVVTPGGSATAAAIAGDPALRAAFDARLSVASPATSAFTAQVDTYHPVDATSGPVTVTLPAGAAKGSVVVLEKEDASANAVTASGSLRDSAGSVSLVWQFESITLTADASGSWWPRAGHKTKSTLDAAYAPVKAQQRGNIVATLGDSIMSGQGNDPINGQHLGMSMPTYALYLAKGRIQKIHNGGIPGNRAADMLARFNTDVTPYSPSVVLIMAGTNDWNDSGTTTLSSYQATMKALVAKCRGIGAQPVLMTVPPNVLSTARRGRTILGNTWLRRYCASEGIPLIDAYNLLVDPTNGDYLAAYGSATNDKTHPTNPGYSALGQLVSSALSSWLSPVDPFLPMENGDPNNLLPNGLFLTTTGSGTTLAPTGWSIQTSVHPSGVTGSLVTGDTAIKGNWWKVVADGTATAINNEFQTISTGIVPGHVYAHLGRFKATGLRNADTGSGSQVLIGVNFNGVVNTAGYDFRAVSTTSYDVADGYFYQEVTAPSDATNIMLRRQLLNTTAGAGTLQVAQEGLYDLTAMGLA